MGFCSTAGTGTGPVFRFQPGREVPDDHCRPIHRARHDPARLHRSRTAALAGYLAGYRGLTRDAYTLDLRQFTTWCRARSLALSAVRRADIEGFARDLETNGRARATVTRRLCIIAGFYRYAVEEELLDHSPAAHVRRPRVDYESHAVALDRNELGAIQLAPRTARAIDLAIGWTTPISNPRPQTGTRRRTAPFWQAHTATVAGAETAAEIWPPGWLLTAPDPPIGMQMAGSVLTADAAQIRSFWRADEEAGR